MEIFLALSEELHFGRTAERLRLSPAMVSQTVKKLERRFGVPLFERTSRKVALTGPGERLRADIAPHFQGIQEAVDRFKNSVRGLQGVVTVGFMGVLAGNICQAVANVFRERHPGCAVRVVETQMRHHCAQLRSGEADIVVIPLPVEEPDLTVGPVVVRHTLHLAVSSENPLARQSSVCVEDLAGETWASLAASVPEYWIDHFYARRTPSGRPIARSSERCDTFTEVLAMVAAGRAVTVGGADMTTYRLRPDITYLPFTDMPPMERAMVWRTSQEDARVRAFVEAVTDTAVPAEPPGCHSA
ncbi:LysR family transcriptional regulator [Streptomyces spectabilis]|nr:LysR family transcriptional regulator [Streptomyces spectabilis]